MPTIKMLARYNSFCSVQFSGRKRLTEQLDRTLPNGFLNMEIMLSHLGVGVAYDALDGLNIHAQRLHLRHIGVAAAVRCEQADIARFFQRFAEHIPEMGGVAGQAGLGAFPDELVGGIPQLDGTRADIQRHRNIPDTVFGFRTADADRTFYDLYCLPDVNDRAIFFNKLRLQSQKFLPERWTERRENRSPAGSGSAGYTFLPPCLSMLRSALGTMAILNAFRKQAS